MGIDSKSLACIQVVSMTQNQSMVAEAELQVGIGDFEGGLIRGQDAA